MPTIATLYHLFTYDISTIACLCSFPQEAELAAERASAQARDPESTRDLSKPLDPAPPPPPLPVGWPPRAPSSEDVAATGSRPQMSLSSLFKDAGGMLSPTAGRRRSSATPLLKLKQVHWDMVMLPSTEGTIWDTGPADQPDDMSFVDSSALFPDLVAEFEIAKVGALTRTQTASSAPSTKKAMKNLLDPKRSQNMTIMLSKFRNITPKAIAKAILELDTSAFEQSVIQVMLDQVPTPEEQRSVKKYFEENGGDSSKLDKAENYVLETAKVPLMAARLNLMLILLSLDDVQHAVESGTNLIFSSTMQLQGSARYRRLMHVILTVGNLLNKGSKKSSAVGFRLSSLSKLIQTKSNAGVSLVDYVVGHLLKQEPEVLQLSSEFTCLQEAKQTSFVSLSGEVAKLAVGISVGSRIMESTENDPSMQEISDKIKSGVDKINATVLKLESLCEEAVHRFNATCLYLGETVSDPATLFGQLIALLDCLDKSTKEVQAKIKRAAMSASTAAPGSANAKQVASGATSLKSVFASTSPTRELDY